MASFQFDLVSPERLLFSGAVDQVDVPGYEGDFGVLAGHAPLISLLRPGILTIFYASQTARIVLGGGFAEVNPRGLTVLAELAVPIEDFDRARLAVEITETEEDLADAKDDWERDKVRHRLEQLHALETALRRS
jgi:F-type H+-transporting ATPase subunit epsilon